MKVLKAMSRSEKECMAGKKCQSGCLLLLGHPEGCKGSLHPFKCIKSRLMYRRKGYDSILDRQKAFPDKSQDCGKTDGLGGR